VIKKERIWLSKNNNKGWLSKIDSWYRQTNIKKFGSGHNGSKRLDIKEEVEKIILVTETKFEEVWYQLQLYTESNTHVLLCNLQE
jgi:hypothetical protein